MRFTASMKARIVYAHIGGRDVSEDLLRHGITKEEFESWVRNFRIMGLRGLKQRCLQEVRRVEVS